MKNFTLVLEDKNQNELERIAITAENKKEANKQAAILKAKRNINDLYKVKVV